MGARAREGQQLLGIQAHEDGQSRVPAPRRMTGRSKAVSADWGTLPRPIACRSRRTLDMAGS